MFVAFFIASQLSAAGLACEYDHEGLSLRSTLTYRYYTVAGRRADDVVTILTRTPKPFGSGHPGAVGLMAYETQTRFRYQSDHQETVTQLCWHTGYTIYLPEFSDPDVAACLTPFVRDVQRHEETHYVQAKHVIESAGRSLIGGPRHAVNVALQKTREMTRTQSDAFHQTPAGQPNQIHVDQLRSCLKNRKR